MYKVFIENRPIIFTQNKINGGKSYAIDAVKIKNIDSDLLPLIHSIAEDIELCVVCEDEKLEFDRLFKHYDKIFAAGGIVRRKNKLLFILRNGFWDIPKGKLDDGESPEEGAIREIEEECGIKGMTIQKPIIETFHTYSYKGVPTLKKTYWFALDYYGSKEVTGQLEEGITKVKWFKIDKLQQVKENTFASILEVLEVYLANSDTDEKCQASV